MPTWQLDAAHSSIGFSTRHMMVSNVRGQFRDFTLDVDFDPEHPELGHVVAVIGAASIDTGMDQRDTHLRSADFLDVAAYPTITFTSTSVVPRPDGTFALNGDLEILGQVRPTTLDVDLLGQVANLKGGLSAGFSSTTKISRKAWGLTWNVGMEAGGLLVGDEIKVEVELELVRPATVADAAEVQVPVVVA